METYWAEQGRNRVREGSSTITLYNPVRLVIYSILSIEESGVLAFPRDAVIHHCRCLRLYRRHFSLSTPEVTFLCFCVSSRLLTANSRVSFLLRIIERLRSDSATINYTLIAFVVRQT